MCHHCYYVEDIVLSVGLRLMQLFRGTPKGGRKSGGSLSLSSGCRRHCDKSIKLVLAHLFSDHFYHKTDLSYPP
jgi:hypothetical protein